MAISYKDYMSILNSERKCMQAFEVFCWWDGIIDITPSVDYQKLKRIKLKPKCPYCDKDDFSYKKIIGRRGFNDYQCTCKVIREKIISGKKLKYEIRPKFNVLTMTVFMGKHVPIRKWFLLGSRFGRMKDNKSIDYCSLQKLLRLDLRMVKKMVTLLREYNGTTNKLNKHYSQNHRLNEYYLRGNVDILWEIRKQYVHYLFKLHPEKFRRINKKDAVDNNLSKNYNKSSSKDFKKVVDELIGNKDDSNQ
jgi:hypothetical protein